MANVNTTQGLVPVKYLNGAPWTGAANMYYIASTDGSAYAIGDPVASSGSADANGVAGVTLAAAGTGNAIRGVIVGAGGIVYGGPGADPANLAQTVIPATKLKSYYVLVVDDPNVVFEVTEVGTGTAFAATDIGVNANLASGTNNGYVSGWQLSNSGATTTSTLQVRLLGLSQVSSNAFGYYAKHLVKINNHELAAGTAGV